MEVSKELLFHASRIGDMDILKELITGGQDLNVTDDHGNSALLLAASNRNVSFVELLIENAVDVNFQNDSGDTALILATKNSDIDMVRLLVLLGANSSICNQQGLKAMDIANDLGAQPITEMLTA